MLKRFTNFFKRVSESAGILRPEAEAEKWTLPDPSIYGNQANLYRQSPALGTAVDMIVSACVDADMDVFVGEYEDEAHEFIQLIDRPNEYESRTEFLRKLFSWRVIAGNSYVWLNRMSKDDAPTEMFVIPASKIIPAPDEKLGLKGYLYYPGNGEEMLLEPFEIMHARSYNPFSRYVGLSLLESIATILYGINEGDKWNTKLFGENNARLPGILAFKAPVADTDWDKIKREVKDAAKKRENILLRGVGDAVTWIQSAATQREMEFIAGIEANTKRIYDRVAPGLHGMITANSSLANGETGLYAFQKFTIAPLLREFADKCNLDIMPAYNDGGIVQYEDVLPQDKAMRLAEIDKFAQFHSIDDVRKEFYKKSEPDENKERGALFVAQIGSLSITPPPDVPSATSPNVPPATPPAAPQDQQPTHTSDVSPVAMPAANEANAAPMIGAKADLDRWRRKAIKNWGSPIALEFTSDHITSNEHADILAELKTCVDVAACKSVFDKRIDAGDALRALAAAIEKAAGNAG